MKGSFAVAIAVAVASAAACGGTNSNVDPTGGDGGTNTSDGGANLPPRPAGPSGIPCNVEKVLADNCWLCHTYPPEFGAPMALTHHDDFMLQRAGKPTHALAVDRTSATDASRMPPSPRAALSPADLKILADWSAAGAPKSTEECNTPKPPPPGIGVTCKPDLSLAPAVEWDMPQASGDEYVCWGAEIAGTPAKHVTGFVPRIDNTSIVHHIVLFESNSAYSSTPQKCSAGGSLQWRMVMGWAPGGKGLELPPDVGFPIVSSGSHYVVQMHYSNPMQKAGQKDKSGFDLCTAPPRKYEADVVAFGTQKIEIQPNQTKTVDCSLKVPSQFANANLLAAMPHMHKLGTAMTTTLVPAGGGPEVDLGTVTGWSFDNQAWLPIQATIKPGDTVRTQCTYKNTTGAPVSFGEKTDEEMCYSFTMYWPRIASPFWSWAAPAVGSTCKP